MKLKKLLVCGLASVMAMAMSITAFAADLSSDEQKIITALTNAGVSADYVTQAKNYLAKDGVTVSAADADAVVAQIQAAKTTAGSAATVSALTAEQRSQILANIKSAATTLGLKVATDGAKITVTDSTGATVFAYDGTAGTIKATGADMSGSIAVIAVLAAALAGCGVVISRRKVAENV